MDRQIGSAMVGQQTHLLPVILTYSSWSYWVFRGKVRAEVGYE
jgi:cytochrome bd-type quinol oxidase subunit 2